MYCWRPAAVPSWRADGWTLADYVEAVGGSLEIIADFGDERLAFAEPGTRPPDPHWITQLGRSRRRAWTVCPICRTKGKTVHLLSPWTALLQAGCRSRVVSGGEQIPRTCRPCYAQAR